MWRGKTPCASRSQESCCWQIYVGINAVGNWFCWAYRTACAVENVIHTFFQDPVQVGTDCPSPNFKPEWHSWFQCAGTALLLGLVTQLIQRIPSLEYMHTTLVCRGEKNILFPPCMMPEADCTLHSAIQTPHTKPCKLGSGQIHSTHIVTYKITNQW